MRKRLVRKICWVSGFLGVFTVIYLGSAIFLHPSSVGNPAFGRYINIWAIIWTTSFLIVFVLAFVLARDLIKLFFEYQAKRAGSRIKAKLVGSHIVVALFPALIMSFLALGLINTTLDQWFKSPSRQLLDSARQLEGNYYSMQRELALQSAREAARSVDLSSPALDSVSLPQRPAEGSQGLIVVDEDGQLLLEKGDWTRPQTRQAALAEARAGLKTLAAEGAFFQRHRSAQTDAGLNGSTTFDYGFAAAPVLGPRGEFEGAVFVRFLLGESSEFHLIGVEEAFAALGVVTGNENAFRVAYFSVISLSTLAVVFGFVWMANYIARRITAPIEALAQGSRELAEGNLGHRVEVDAIDELGVLVDSFNRMAHQIRESRRDLEKANAGLRASNTQLDERRRYIETVLHNIATGVVSIDEGDVVQSVNDAALKMFGIDRERVLHRPVREFSDQHFHQEYLKLKRRAQLYGTYRKELSVKPAGRQLRIAATITRSPDDETSRQYLVVLDDISELIQAEKFAAWQEVARRLAHEIKNPLTPIQLSAERVRKRFQRIAQSEGADPREVERFGEVLQDAMEIIVDEARILKRLVHEFSRFARMPACKLQPVGLHELIDRTLKLYDSGLEGVVIRRDFDRSLAEVAVDPDLMQRAFINLIDNSLDALAERNGDRLLDIRTRLHASRRSVGITFSDNGCGIEPEDYENLFLPYFSTKQKGTGLGLAIVRQIVSEHNGSIRAQPNTPHGTSFVMNLPLG